MPIKFHGKELSRRMKAVLVWCDELGITMPTGQALDLAINMVEFTPQYGRLKSGNTQDLDKSLHVYLLVEWIKAHGKSKAVAVEFLSGLAGKDASKWNYMLGTSRLSRLHQSGQRGPLGELLKDRTNENGADPRAIIRELIVEYAPQCDWTTDLPEVSN